MRKKNKLRPVIAALAVLCVCGAAVLLWFALTEVRERQAGENYYASLHAEQEEDRTEEELSEETRVEAQRDVLLTMLRRREERAGEPEAPVDAGTAERPGSGNEAPAVTAVPGGSEEQAEAPASAETVIGRSGTEAETPAATAVSDGLEVQIETPVSAETVIGRSDTEAEAPAATAVPGNSEVQAEAPASTEAVIDRSGTEPGALTTAVPDASEAQAEVPASTGTVMDSPETEAEAPSATAAADGSGSEPGAPVTSADPDTTVMPGDEAAAPQTSETRGRPSENAPSSLGGGSGQPEAAPTSPNGQPGEPDAPRDKGVDARTADISPEEETEFLTMIDELEIRPSAMDFASIQETCPDVVGWIRIDGTVIDYPIVQGADNEYYLHHLADRTENSNGAIMMEVKNDPLWQDMCTTLHGHHMNSGAMFGDLSDFDDAEYYLKHPMAHVYTPLGDFEAQIFGLRVIDPGKFRYPIDLPEDEFETLVRDFKNEAPFKAPVDVAYGDRVLLLSTCEYTFPNARFILMARLVPWTEEAPDAAAEEAGAVQTPDPQQAGL